MRKTQVILTACLLTGLLSAAAGARAEDRNREDNRAPADSQRGGSRHGGDQRAMRDGMMGPDLMQQTMIAQFIGNKSVAEKLGITEEQRAQISDVIQTSRTAQIRLHAEQEIAAMEQVRLLTAEVIDEKAVMAAVEKTGQLSAEIAKWRIMPIVKIKQILSPEQIAQAQEMMRTHVRERRGGQGERGDLKSRPGRRGDRTTDDDGPDGGMPPPPPQEDHVE